MQFSVNYNSCPAIRDKVDEIKINYIKDFGAMQTFLEKHKHQRICFKPNPDNFDPKSDLPLMATLQKSNPDYNFFFLVQPGDETYFGVENFKKNGIKFAVEIYIPDWDILNYYIDLGVSDVFVRDSLGFELDKVAAIAHAKGVRVRVIANATQSSAPSKTPYKTFFIRPEDLKYYEPYVDVCEFWGDKEEVYYKIYHDDKKWFGPLKEIILGFKDDVDNRSIPEDFYEARIRCGKKCAKGSLCHLCDTIITFAKALQERHLMYNRKG